MGRARAERNGAQRGTACVTAARAGQYRLLVLASAVMLNLHFQNDLVYTRIVHVWTGVIVYRFTRRVARRSPLEATVGGWVTYA